MKILVIDDDKVFVEPLMWALNEHGYEAEYCKSVDDVLDEEGKVKISRPDCIILDILMPRGSRYSKRETDGGRSTGLKLLEDIQKKYSKIPVIVVTVCQNLNIIDLKKKFGEAVKKVLVKPVTPTDVINAIKRHSQKQPNL